MADGQQYDTSQLDEVQHPTLGTLKFPKAMPFEERNRMIADMEAKAPKQGERQTGTQSTNPLDKIPKREGLFGSLLKIAKGVFGAEEIGTGAIRGAGSTGYNLANLTNKGIRASMDLGPGSAEDLAKAKEFVPAFPKDKPEILEPKNAREKVGYGAEQIGEFFVPGGAVEKGAKAVDTAVDAAKLMPAAARFLKLAGRGGLEAATTGAVTAAQGGDVKTNATIAGLMPFGAAALEKPLQAAAEKVAPQIANKLLRPVPTRLENAARFGRNPGKAIAEEGIIATSHADLLDKIQAKKAEVGQVIGNTLQAANKTGKVVDARPLIEKPIDDAIKDVISGKIEGGQAMIDKLEELRATLTHERQLVNGKLTSTGQKNLTISPADAHALKRQIGDATKWSEDTMTQAVNDVKRSIYRNLNDEIEGAVPGVKKDQLRYGNLLEAEKSAERELARHEARNPFSLLDTLIAAGGMAGGAAHGETGKGIAVGAGLAAANKAMRTPLAKTLEVQGVKNAPKLVDPRFLKWARNVAFGAQSESQQ